METQQMRIRNFKMICNCNGYVSEQTFNEFIEWVDNVANDMFDGEIFVIDIEEDIIDDRRM